MRAEGVQGARRRIYEQTMRQVNLTIAAGLPAPVTDQGLCIFREGYRLNEARVGHRRLRHLAGRAKTRATAGTTASARTSLISLDAVPEFKAALTRTGIEAGKLRSSLARA
jgi:hypothetical protein